jgi:hypothetical protein
MVSGSYNGASVKVNDWLIVGAVAALGIGAYFWFKNNPFIKAADKAGNLLEDVSNIPGAVVNTAKNAGSNVVNNVKDLVNKVKTLNVKGRQPTINDAPVKGYQPSDESLTVLGYNMSPENVIDLKSSSLNAAQFATQQVTGFKDLAVLENIMRTLPSNSGKTKIKGGPPTKSLNIRPTGKTISESTGTSSGKVFVTRADGSTGSYQLNTVSGTGSINTHTDSKSLNPQKGVTNIISNISHAQSTGQSINLTGLGKGARINLDTGNVSY